MYETQIKLNTINDVKDMVSIVTQFPCDFEIIEGRFVVDAKSIMGIFTLDLSKNLTFVIKSENDDEIDKCLSDIKRFVAE